MGCLSPAAVKGRHIPLIGPQSLVAKMLPLNKLVACEVSAPTTLKPRATLGPASEPRWEK